YPREYNAVNVGGTVALMEAMRDVGVKRVVFISSGAVYGDQARQPLAETSKPDPRSPYAVSKLAAEYYVRTIGALWGIETICLRVFNAYGPGQHLPPSHPPVIPNMLRQAVGNGTVIVHGDGGQTRDFVYVDDVMRAMVAAATAQNVDREIVNVGSGVETSIAELAQVILRVTASGAEIVHSPRTGPGVGRLCADLTRARQLLGYQPRVELEEGLRLTLAHDPRFQKV
ncbi:MAG TPA: NAD-dependent epimerase/dehydratase family protein, partial [Anaerolineales bacterium]|nr:NAD-dependent epimerase/dehydratase family protein [Anaerolineales bacterium]